MDDVLYQLMKDRSDDSLKVELCRRLIMGIDALDLSVEVWQMKEKMVEEGHEDIPLSPDSCPLCLSHTPESKGFVVCVDCEYWQFYGQDCDHSDSAYNKITEGLDDLEDGDIDLHQFQVLVHDMLVELQVMQEARNNENESKKD